MRKLNSLLLIPFALSFMACGPASGNISGTITAPVGVIVNQSVVIAISCSSSCTQLGSTAANAAASTNGTYTLLNVPGGQYVVAAGQDNNGNGKIDHIGAYGGSNASAVQPPASGINITMQPVTESASLTTASAPAALLEAIRKILK
jgi:uncharacterized protein (DUF2141 family)